ncbi:MAG: hypothetical protein WCC69_11365 [Pirellulales bacterium]
MSTAPNRSHDDAAAPAEALGGVWELLDELPPATVSRTLAATTVELVAASTAARSRSGWRRWIERWFTSWRGPAAIVGVALVAGIVTGRLSQPGLDGRLLDDLPLVQHLDLLREAGSEKFLEAVAARDPGVPPRLVVRAGPEAAARAAAAWRTELDSLASALSYDRAPPAERLQARRDQLATLSLEDKVELERAARDFGRLSPTERQAVAAVARAIVDPTRPQLREAAVVWHQWLAAVRPEDRAEIIGAGTDKRLEWIDWYARRPEGFGRPGVGPRPGPGPGPRPSPPDRDPRGAWQRRPSSSPVTRP